MIFKDEDRKMHLVREFPMVNIQIVSQYVFLAWESEPLAYVIPVSMSGNLNSMNPYN